MKNVKVQQAKMNTVVINSNEWSNPELGKSIEQLNWLSGGVLYNIEAKTRYQHWHFFFMKFNTLMLLLELFYFTFLVPFDLLNFITAGIQLTLIILILFLAPWSQKQRSNVANILNWMTALPKRDYPIKRPDIKLMMENASSYSLRLHGL